MTNQVTVTGNVGAAPELRGTNGDDVAQFSIADRHRKKQGDQWVDDGTTWWRVSAWGHLGVECSERLTKGTRVTVTGKARLREYTDRDGQQRTSLEITADQVSLPLPKYPPRDPNEQPRYQRPSQGQQPMDDPWGSAPSSDGFTPDDQEAPF